MKFPGLKLVSPQQVAAACAALVLSACGGGGDVAAPTEASVSPAVIALPASAGTSSAGTGDAVSFPDAGSAAQEAQPFFHMAPVELDPPSDVDVADPNASSRLPRRSQAVPPELARIPTRGLTLDTLRREKGKPLLGPVDKDPVVDPMAFASQVSTYTPAQVRAAYGLPELPVPGASLTAAQAARLGAGQTIYVVDAYHNPSMLAELNAFNQKFGLPACTVTAIPVSTRLPLASASTTAGCSFSVVYSTAAATMTGTAPAYHAGWATEIALDVQWAHAMAPLARIVLIEAPDARLESLTGAIRLANAMGPGVVSMSFGSPEGSWMGTVDAAFTGAGMSYLAATGDNGAGVSWPAASARVLAVGGTSLDYSGSGARAEQAWSGSGGGTSQFVATPSYQASKVPGVGSLSRRTVPDVAFNANPSTGQYIAQIPPGSSTPSWLSVGGTSLSTPQWAGLVAVANALRAQAGKPALGLTQSSLYADIAGVPGAYYGAFLDITAGSNGGCSLCTARTGFDAVTGLGTPHAVGLLAAWSAQGAAVAPTVSPATVNGVVGTPLSFAVSVKAAAAVRFSLAGAPSGMTIDTAGTVTWPAPVLGSYAVTVTATDPVSGLAGKGVYTVKVSAPPPVPPTLSVGDVQGEVGKALSVSARYSSPNAASFSLSGAPAGMTVSATGVIVWSTPKAGNYVVTLTLTDTKTRLSAKASFKVVITAPLPPAVSGPTIQATRIQGVAGQALKASIGFSTPGSSSFWISVTGVPPGAYVTLAGQSLQLTWPSPVSGSYTMKLTVKDGAGRSASADLPLTIQPR